MHKRNWKGILVSVVLVAAVSGTSAVAWAGEEGQTAKTRQTSVTAESELAGQGEEAADSSPDEEAIREEIAASLDLDLLERAKDDRGRKGEDWLPIGSVVLLKGSNKTLMVMSRFVYNQDDGLYYEYCGCLYPEGIADSEYFFFNQDQIGLVAQEGYVDDYEKIYREMVLDGIDIGFLNQEAESETETE